MLFILSHSQMNCRKSWNKIYHLRYQYRSVLWPKGPVTVYNVMQSVIVIIIVIIIVTYVLQCYSGI